MKRFFLQALPWTALLGICCSAAGASESDNYVIGEPNCRVVNANPQDNERVTWNGECKDGFADGAGFLQWYLGEDKSSSYEGELRHGLPNGHGVYQYSSKARYEGEFKDGLREGKGILISPNGSKLEATFVAGSASGYGEQTFSNGAWYRGQWKNGKYDGKGKMRYADGTVYEGDFKAGLREGRGKLQYAAGGFYEGDFKSGMRDGTGSLTMVNGNRYEGGWLKDGYEGVGTMHYASGASYVGGWKLGKYDGTGKVTEADGRTYEAQYREGIRVDQPALADNTSYAARVLRASSAVAEYTGPYQDAKRHKAFAQSPFGTWGFAVDKPSEDEAKAAALEKCGRDIHDGEPPCFIVGVGRNAIGIRLCREVRRDDARDD